MSIQKFISSVVPQAVMKNPIMGGIVRSEANTMPSSVDLSPLLNPLSQGIFSIGKAIDDSEQKERQADVVNEVNNFWSFNNDILNNEQSGLLNAKGLESKGIVESYKKQAGDYLSQTQKRIGNKWTPEQWNLYQTRLNDILRSTSSTLTQYRTRQIEDARNGAFKASILNSTNDIISNPYNTETTQRAEEAIRGSTEALNRGQSPEYIKSLADASISSAYKDAVVNIAQESSSKALSFVNSNLSKFTSGDLASVRNVIESKKRHEDVLARQEQALRNIEEKAQQEANLARESYQMVESKLAETVDIGGVKKPRYTLFNEENGEVDFDAVATELNKYFEDEKKKLHSDTNISNIEWNNRFKKLSTLERSVNSRLSELKREQAQKNTAKYIEIFNRNRGIIDSGDVEAFFKLIDGEKDLNMGQKSLLIAQFINNSIRDEEGKPFVTKKGTFVGSSSRIDRKGLKALTSLRDGSAFKEFPEFNDFFTEYGGSLGKSVIEYAQRFYEFKKRFGSDMYINFENYDGEYEPCKEIPKGLMKLNTSWLNKDVFNAYIKSLFTGELTALWFAEKRSKNEQVQPNDTIISIPPNIVTRAWENVKNKVAHDVVFKENGGNGRRTINLGAINALLKKGGYGELVLGSDGVFVFRPKSRNGKIDQNEGENANNALKNTLKVEMDTKEVKNKDGSTMKVFTTSKPEPKEQNKRQQGNEYPVIWPVSR